MIRQAISSAPRRTRLPWFWSVLLLAMCAAGNACAQSVLDSIGAELHGIYAKTRDSVVRVKAEPMTGGPARMGSGFFIDESGKLLTTASIVTNSHRIWIEWQNQEYPVQVVGSDSRANLALLRVMENAPPAHRFPALTFDDSRPPEVGTPVVALGNPFDPPPTPSMGIVGGFDLHQLTHVFVTSHLRVDIALSPGEGGSPLLNSHARVVGILVASSDDEPVCYALPSRAIQRLVADFEQYGEARYGWMGMKVFECSPDQPGHPSCLKVQQVFANTPAARAGIQPDDRICKVDGEPVVRKVDMVNACFAARVGQRLNIEIQRQALQTNLFVEVVQRPSRLSPTLPPSSSKEK